MDAETRSLARRCVSDARRRLAGAELDERGQTDMQLTAMKDRSLPRAAWEACDGDPLLALASALDWLEASGRESKLPSRLVGSRRPVTRPRSSRA